MLTPRFLLLTLLGIALSSCIQPSKTNPNADPQNPRIVQAGPQTRPEPLNRPADRAQTESAAQPAKEMLAPTRKVEEAKGYKAADAVAERDALNVVGSLARMAAPRGYGTMAPAAAPAAEFNTENYRYQADNSFARATEKPLSTFSADVDTASYANVRRFLTTGSLPPKDAVRIEELVNYFPYGYPEPKYGEPFGVRLDMAEAPWNPQHRLVRIGIQSKKIAWNERKPANLVFLLDVSGSMAQPNKLPLVIDSLKLLAQNLTGQDRVAIVVYAGASGLVLPSTSGNQREVITRALDQLSAGGSTNGGAGIMLAYGVAQENFIRGGINRVILATDGDFNVGVTGEGDLVQLVQDKAKSGVYLTVLGFGMGNLKDATLEQIADKGNGHYAYIDSEFEARKMFIDQIGGTLQTVAKDVKFQVEFNPAAVESYRLIGYENRLLQDHEFNDDQVDAGDVGAGHSVTALYEIVSAGGSHGKPRVDPLKYQTRSVNSYSQAETLTLKIRYKEPDGETSKLLSYPLHDGDRRLADTDADFRFAAAVATWGMVLRDSTHKGQSQFELALSLAKGAQGDDSRGYRAEFITLIHKAKAMVQTAMPIE